MRPVFLLLLALLPLSVGCVEGNKASPLARLAPTKTTIPTVPDTKPERSLFDKLGGDSGLKTIVDGFVTVVAADEKVPERLKKPLMDDDAKQVLVGVLAEATGGPKGTAPKTLKDIWKEADLTAAEFTTLSADLLAALMEKSVDAPERQGVLSVFQTLKKDVVKPAE